MPLIYIEFNEHTIWGSASYGKSSVGYGLSLGTTIMSVPNPLGAWLGSKSTLIVRVPKNLVISSIFACTQLSYFNNCFKRQVKSDSEETVL